MKRRLRLRQAAPKETKETVAQQRALDLGKSQVGREPLCWVTSPIELDEL